MKKFTGRIVWLNNDQAYKKVVKQRDETTDELKKFVKQQVAPAQQKPLMDLIRQLVYAHQQTVWWQTTHDVDEGDIDTY